MKWLLIPILASLLGSCNTNKERLAGSYKLDKTEADKRLDQLYYAASIFTSSEDNSFYSFFVTSNVDPNNNRYQGQFQLIPTTKDGKRYITSKLTIDENELQNTHILDNTVDLVQTTDFLIQNLKIKIKIEYTCKDADCKTIAFTNYISFYTPTKKEPFRYSFAIYTISKSDSGYKISKRYRLADAKDAFERYSKDPQYLIKIPLDSPELTSW